MRIRAVMPEPSLFAHIKHGSRRRVRPKIRHLAPLDGCACAFEEWVYGRRTVTVILPWISCWWVFVSVENTLHFIVCSQSFIEIISANKIIYEPPHDKTNKMACAPSEDSDQPGHPPRLIRVFVVRLKEAWVLSYPLSAQRRLWSDWADAQADLSLRWAYSHFVGFVMRRLNYIHCLSVLFSGTFRLSNDGGYSKTKKSLADRFENEP